MKIKTLELIDITLDWAVAKCKGENGVLHDDGIARCIVIAAASGVYKGTWKPSVNWSQGGPIIEREEICTKRQAPASVGYEWNAWIWTKHIAKGGSSAGGSGPTPLIAAMRCYVASMLGEEVEIPNELIGE